ncbi:hypothetical protein PAXRUDRAFT_165905, partial [Paxillus rubicundulus Ve08.2h10]
KWRRQKSPNCWEKEGEGEVDKVEREGENILGVLVEAITGFSAQYKDQRLTAEY